jgi:hypothetical protein
MSAPDAPHDYSDSAAAINDSRVVVGWDEHDTSLEPSPYRIACPNDGSPSR